MTKTCLTFIATSARSEPAGGGTGSGAARPVPSALRDITRAAAAHTVADRRTFMNFLINE